MSYTIYHLPDQNKIGLAKDVIDRVENQQGYSKGEYRIILDNINDLETARMVEKAAQKEFNCEEDDGPDLVDLAISRKFRKFKNKSTGVAYKSIKGITVGFPSPIDQFKDWVNSQDAIAVEDSKGITLVFKHQQDKDWLISNARASKYASPERATYIYIKAAHKYFDNLNSKSNGQFSNGRVDGLLDNIYQWADNRGILKGKIETQTLKLGEEFGELQKAVLKSDSHEIKDAIGDIIVVLVSIAHFNGHNIADSLQLAYDTISKRTGYTNDKGDFIKTHFDGKIINDTL